MDGYDTTDVTCSVSAYVVSSAKIKRLARFVCGQLGVGAYQLSVTLCGSAAIKRLNRQYRGKDRPTDVLSFPQQAWRSPRRVGASEPRTRSPRRSALPPAVLGDLVISLPDAERNARRIGQPLDREVCFLMVHGILHLCGHDHENARDERRMLAAQRTLMELLAGSGARPLWRSSVRRGARVRVRRR